MKKFLAIIMTLAIALTMAATVFAAETFDLTIAGIKDHTYEVYQIYIGDVADEDGTLVLSNVKYGANHTPAGGKKGDPVPDSELKNFLNSVDPANYFVTSVSGDPITVNAKGTENSVTISVEPGYYMIMDVTKDLPDGQTKSPIILKVAEETTVASKHATIVSTKKVDDKNDSTTEENAVKWVDSADYDIGDDVPFQLTVSLPSTLNAYKNYKLTFHDKQAAGFDAPKNFKVFVKRGDAALFELEADTDYTLSDTCVTPDKCEYKDQNGCTFALTVTDVKATYEKNNVDFEDGDIIVVEYTSTLNNTANIGRAGNENSMYVCHPDGHTPKDDVTVLTYELKVNKIDGADKTALEGAGFTLQKWIEDDGEWVNIGEEIKGSTSFTWSGIDGGKYKLKETTTPAGYNTIADIEFVINATHKDIWLADGNYALEDVIAKDPSGTTVVFADKNAEGLLDGKLEGNVENFKGVVLPETGAEGTLWLIGGGALLVILAAVFMITRKKMSVFED